eukprot:6075093-Karenia_brevis.AAC.1
MVHASADNSGCKPPFPKESAAPAVRFHKTRSTQRNAPSGKIPQDVVNRAQRAQRGTRMRRMDSGTMVLDQQFNVNGQKSGANGQVMD